MSVLEVAPGQDPKDIVVSILIVNWNVRELLEGCLESVYRETRLSRDAFEVIVVDNASRDGSVAMLAERFPQVKVIANQENIGFGKANNQALADCRGRYLFLLNPDTLMVRDALDHLIEAMDRDERIAAIGPKLLNGDGSLQRWTGGSFPSVWTASCHYLFLNRLLPRTVRPPSLYLDQDYEEPVEVDWLSGAALLLRRSALEGRLFDERFFMYGEDMELCHRLKAKGGRILYFPQAQVIHFQGASMKQQTGEVLTTSLAGLRSFYGMTRGPGLLWAIDAVTVVGFLARYIIYGALAVVRPGRGFREKASSSRAYLSLSVRVMAGSRGR